MAAGMSIEARARRVYHDLQRRRQALPKVRVGGIAGVPTVYYLTPDYDVPSGGIRTIYRHVDLLNDAGIPAAVMHQRRGFRCTWFPHRTRTTDARSSPLGPDDLLVVPETDAAVLPRLPTGTRHVVFNQSGHLTWDRDPGQVTGHYLHSPDLAGVMVVSGHSEELLRYAFGRPVHNVRLSIDQTLFRPPIRPGGRTISYMPRRGRSDVETVLHILRARGALAGWSVDALDGVDQPEVARRLRGSTIFLSTPYQEGFGLPAAEAMACGNVVIGFDGFGGREFFRPEFSLPVPTGDVLAMARAVEECLLRESVEPGWCFARGVRASAHIFTEYSPQRERAAVLDFFHAVGLTF